MYPAFWRTAAAYGVKSVVFAGAEKIKEKK